MAKSQVEAVKASVPQATERLRMLDQSAAEAVALKVRQVGHFLRVMSDLSCGVPKGRADICAEAFSVVMEELAERCMAAETEIEQLGNRVEHG